MAFYLCPLCVPNHAYKTGFKCLVSQWKSRSNVITSWKLETVCLCVFDLRTTHHITQVLDCTLLYPPPPPRQARSSLCIAATNPLPVPFPFSGIKNHTTPCDGATPTSDGSPIDRIALTQFAQAKALANLLPSPTPSKKIALFFFFFPLLEISTPSPKMKYHMLSR